MFDSFSETLILFCVITWGFSLHFVERERATFSTGEKTNDNAELERGMKDKTPRMVFGRISQGNKEGHFTKVELRDKALEENSS